MRVAPCYPSFLVASCVFGQVVASRARQSSARRAVACDGPQRTDAPYPPWLRPYRDGHILVDL